MDYSLLLLYFRFYFLFFVAFYNFDEILKIDLKNIAKNYLDEWFILDLIAAIPIKTLLFLFDHKCKNFTFMINPLYHNNLNYLLYFIKIVKLYKVLYKNKFIEIISNFLSEIKHFSDYLKCIFKHNNIFNSITYSRKYIYIYRKK